MTEITLKVKITFVLCQITKIERDVFFNREVLTMKDDSVVEPQAVFGMMNDVLTKLRSGELTPRNLEIFLMLGKKGDPFADSDSDSKIHMGKMLSQLWLFVHEGKLTEHQLKEFANHRNPFVFYN